MKGIFGALMCFDLFSNVWLAWILFFCRGAAVLHYTNIFWSDGWQRMEGVVVGGRSDGVVDGWMDGWIDGSMEGGRE